ncbi:MAG: HNH endonuclease signature motif containing protein [Isosphaeraceae bacterium]|jgi:HNH endonuclease
MDATIKRSVRDRARHRCEYCRLPQAAQPYVTFHIEHVLPRKHGGSDDPSNLALACERCNAFKGTDLSGIDPDTGQVERLFDPRTQVWADHFELRGALILGRTSTGRATVAVLGMNEDRRVLLRAEILTLGEF